MLINFKNLHLHETPDSNFLLLLESEYILKFRCLIQIAHYDGGKTDFSQPDLPHICN